MSQIDGYMPVILANILLAHTVISTAQPMFSVINTALLLPFYKGESLGVEAIANFPSNCEQKFQALDFIKRPSPPPNK